jgi:hypothetical protein
LSSIEVDSGTAEHDDRFKKFLFKAKGAATKTKNNAKDTKQGLWKSFGRQTRTLCTACEQVPFNECLPTDDSYFNTSDPPTAPDSGPLVFCMSLSQILAHRDWCKFCGLLYRSCCQPENDLLKASHIKDHLHDSEKLKNIGTFADWVEEFPKWKQMVGGQDIWPFGFAVDQTQAARNTLSRAKELFFSAEHKDLNTKSLLEDIDKKYGTDDTAETAAQAVNFGIGVAGIMNNKASQEAQRLFAGAQLAASQLAMVTGRRRKRLPCLFVIRAYRKDEKKAGVLSVRVYAHGRAPLAQLNEICHFSLRFEGSGEPRVNKQQIWYGRTLSPRIDVEFFEKCTRHCQELHEGCNGYKWTPVPQDLELYSQFPFRLIDVHSMCIIETDFERSIQSGPGEYHLNYVCLSYTWGPKQEGQGVPTRLTSRNKRALRKGGALNSPDIYIPATVRDAIEITRRAGQHYLWVDSLCIIQEEGHEDNMANIARMGRIYGEAIFTIVAADSTHEDEGIKGISSDRDSYDQIMEPEIVQGTQVFLPVAMKHNYDPWESRAWCFQEKVLSRRLLIFSGGFASWHCAGGVWREDVNALDGDGGAAALPWQRLAPVPPAETVLQQAGIQEFDEDESMRLHRSAAFAQYASTVEDFSTRTIGDSWRILDAFKGVQSLLESENICNSTFRHGLPSQFIDIALLWQPKDPVCRRENKPDKYGNVVRYCPPSWTWAGWEAVGAGSKGASVGYDQPFDIRVDDVGMMMRTQKLGEERVRPLKGLVWGKEVDRPKIVPLGILGLPGIEDAGFKDWEADTTLAVRPQRVLEKGQLSDRHLVLQTEVGILQLGKQCVHVKKRTKIGDVEYCRDVFDPPQFSVKLDEGTSISRERWVIDPETNKNVGIVKMNEESALLRSKNKQVTAIILSEAQYLGTEKRVDVLGYPVYNIMVIEWKSGKIAERIGLGKVYKSAWRRARPTKDVIVLE